ncbi:MAG: ROK family protein [Halobacteriales archaeon]
MAYYAGIDLGATNIRAAVTDEEGEIVGLDDRETPQGPTGVQVTEGVLAALRAACGAADVDPDAIAAVGIGSIGPLDLAAGTIEDPANLPDAIDTVPLRDPIAELVGSDQVYLHNDTTAGVIGERFHAEPIPDDMIYLTISSGIGAGIAVDGRVLRGWDGNAGEVGHIVVDPAGRRVCGCGHDGHWEAYCSGENIPEYARLLHGEEPVGTDLPLDDPEFAAADVFEHAGEDPLADRVIDRVARWNAIGITNVIHSFAPLVIAIGGAVALRNESLVIDPIRERVEEMVWTALPEIRATSLGEDAVLRGAIASALTGGTGSR